MIDRIARLFVIKTRFEAYAVIYALAVGGVERGMHYFDQFPGAGGYLLFLACTGSVFMAGAKILDAVPGRRRPAPTALRGDRRQVERRDLDGAGRKKERRRGDRRQAGRRAADPAQLLWESPA